MTVLYVAMIADRHCDPEPFLFTSESAAIEFARRTAQDWLIELAGGADGWLYYAKHPTEEDAVWVLAKAVDDPDAKP